MNPPEQPFDEPWHAQAFALARALHDQGRFAWTDFSAELGRALREPGGDDYWASWLTALERVAVAHELTSDDALTDRQDAWRRAARATPHGQPITIRPDGA